jgi:hypothetical protein
MSFITTLVADLFARPLIRDQVHKDLDPNIGFYKSITIFQSVLYGDDLVIDPPKSFEGLAHKQLEQIKQSRSYTYRPKLVFEGPVNLLDPCDSRVSWHSPEWWLIRETLSDTERFLGNFNGMTFSQYKRKVVIMGAPSVGTSSFLLLPARFVGYANTSREDVFDTTIRRSADLCRGLFPNCRSYNTQDNHPRGNRI